MSEVNNNPNISFYNDNAEDLAEMYNSVNTEDVHSHIVSLVPKSSKVLDIGCGSGRDAYYFASKGHSVVAVDPAVKILETAKEKYSHHNLVFLDDKLPDLEKIKGKYDVVIMSAVWMHIEKKDRLKAAKRVTNLLNPQGIAVISLRHGAFKDNRKEIPVSVDEIENILSKDLNINVSVLNENENDNFNREGVSWQTVIIKNTDKPKLINKQRGRR